MYAECHLPVDVHTYNQQRKNSKMWMSRHWTFMASCWLWLVVLALGIFTDSSLGWSGCVDVNPYCTSLV